MQRIYSGDQVKLLDQEFLNKTGIASHVLMETAASEFVRWFLEEQIVTGTSIIVVVGPGNNGGDGFVIARLLSELGFNITVVEMFESTQELSPDTSRNKKLLPANIPSFTWDIFSFDDSELLIDCFLGVGLKGPLRDFAASKVDWINQFKGKIISVDLPSGLGSDHCDVIKAVKAEVTVTFQFPKLSLFAPELGEFSGDLVVLPIGITDSENEKLFLDKFYLQAEDIKPLHRAFNRFSFKGDFGKILLVGGSYGKMGALQLASKSALRTGAGLVTCLVDESGIPILQTSVPEAMCLPSKCIDLDSYDSIGIGPGWSLENREELLLHILTSFSRPVVIDADGLNLLGNSPQLIRLIPKNSILTPHIGEFKRLVGPSKDFFERIKLAKEFAQANQVILVLKGPNSVISLPDGRQIFNSSGTKYMATGGSGDVLTGMITAYLGMGYTSENAALCGVYHHGLAGELAGQIYKRGLIATDLIESIPETYRRLTIS